MKSADVQAPPQNLEAERSVLGAMLVSESAVSPVIDEVKLRAEDFYLDRHRTIFRVIFDQRALGKPTDELSVIEALKRRGELEKAGDRHYVSELAATVPAVGNAAHHARIVQETSQLRDLLGAGRRIQDLVHERNGDRPDDLRREAEALLERIHTAGAAPVARPDRTVDGAAFILDLPEEVPAIWGNGQEIFWSEGEPFLLVGPPGLGKTSLLGQLALARLGIGGQELLGYRVALASGTALYVAADRPLQVARSFRRMVGEGDRDLLQERLRVWRGPLPFDLAAEPERFLPFCERHEADTVFVDSLGAVAFDLASDEGGARVAAAFNETVAAGIHLAVAHHDRKREQ